MAHELTIRANGRADMAYVGETPWHGLGQEVTKGASIGVWRRESGLDWEAKEATVHFIPDRPAGGSALQDRGCHLAMPERKVIYRSDTQRPIGDVSSKYKLVQPGEMLEFFRDLTESGGWHIHTAGSLRGGAKIWAMASSEELSGRVGKSDRVLGNLLLATSMDGSMRTTAKLTAVRVVCANTLALALNPGLDEPSVTVSHRSSFNADEVKRSLGVSVPAFEAFMAQAQALSETGIGLDEARGVLRDLFGQPKATASGADAEFHGMMAQFGVSSGPLREQRSVDRAMDLFSGAGLGSSLPGSAGTRWGLLNAVTQHIDYERGWTADTRMDSAWFGKGDEIKRAALRILEVA